MLRHKTKWGLAILAVAAAVVAVLCLSDEIDWRGLRHAMEQMNKAPLLALTAFLPLFGFSIGIVYLVIGAVFGGWVGMAVVAGITAVHLLGSHWIGHSFLREPLQRFLKKRKKHLPTLPEGEDGAIALMTALVPGLPYFARNYLLALSGIPLRTYFWICWPVYVIRSGLVIFLGDFSGDFSTSRVSILGGALVVKVAICAFIIHRLRKHHHQKREKARARAAHATAAGDHPHAREHGAAKKPDHAVGR